MANAVIYARYSSAGQNEQSIEGQLRFCKSYAERNQLTVVKTYVDRACTGTNDNRPQFRQMISDSSSGLWQTVLVYRFDRFARNQYDAVVNKHILKGNGCRLVSCDEAVPDDDSGKLLEALLDVMAENYSTSLSKRVRLGLEQSRLKGNFTGGHVEFGYAVENKKYKINDAEADVVRTVFSRFLGGASAGVIVRELTEKNFFARNGKPLTTAMIYKMLHNPHYVGVSTHGDQTFTDTVPAIIDGKTWDATQNALSGYRHTRRTSTTQDGFALSGKLFCGKCGSPMTGDSGTGKSGNTYFYYTCAKHKKRASDCHSHSIKKSDIENLVFDTCRKLFTSGMIDDICRMAAEYHKQNALDTSSLDTVTAEIKEKEKALGNIMRAIEAGIFNDRTQSRMTELQSEIDNLNFRKAQEETRLNAGFNEDDFRAYLDGILDKLPNDCEFKDYVINFFVRKVTVYDYCIRICFNYSPDGGGKTHLVPSDTSETEHPDAPPDPTSPAEKCSNTVTSFPPTVTYSNPIFYTLNYWGLWTKKESR